MRRSAAGSATSEQRWSSVLRVVGAPVGPGARLSRTAAVAVVAMLLLVLGATAGVASSSAFLAAAASEDLPRREMNDEVVVNGMGWLIFKGDVDPGWSNRSVQIYKRACRSCAWKLVRKTPTDDSGRWRTRIYAPRTGYWLWKGIVPRAGDYGKSVTRIYRTYVV